MVQQGDYVARSSDKDEEINGVDRDLYERWLCTFVSYKWKLFVSLRMVYRLRQLVLNADRAST